MRHSRTVLAVVLIGAISTLGTACQSKEEAEKEAYRRDLEQRAAALFEETDELMFTKYMQLSASCDTVDSKCMEVNAAIFDMRHDMKELCRRQPKYCPSINAALEKAQRLSPWMQASDWN